LKETLKIGQEMRSASELHVSKPAIKEYIDRVKAGIDPNMNIIDSIAKKEGRKTIMKDDVIRYFGYNTASSVGNNKNNEWF